MYYYRDYQGGTLMLKRVKIQGYKSLVDLEVKLQPLSVFFGPNASGKSNFLDALQLLSKLATSNSLNEAFEPPYRGKPLESFTFGPEGVEGLLKKEKVAFSIEVDVEFTDKIVDAVNSQARSIIEAGALGKPNKDVLDVLIAETIMHEKNLRYGIEIEILPKLLRLRVAKEYFIPLNTEGRPIEGASFLEHGGTLLNLNGNQISFPNGEHRSILSTPSYVGYYPYLQAMRQELLSWFFYYLEPRERMRIPSPVKEVRRIGLMGEEIDAFINTLHAVDEPQFKALEKALHMIIPSITGIDVSINNLGDVELRLMQGKTPISTRLLSEGTLRILGLLALAGSKEPSALVGLEEPENGIHPARIRLIASLLETRSRNGSQMIVTTHSPLLTDMISHESLYVCRKDNGRTIIEPFALWEYPEDIHTSDEEGLPELSVSERILRGDFDA